MDLLLSSGFLAFARHCGVLTAIEESELPIDAVVGTSSGALVGSLWCAGVPAKEVAARISAQTPWSLIRFGRRPWSGLFTMGGAGDLLSPWLPDRLEDLPRPLAVGVMRSDRSAHLVTEGPSVSSVLASCSMPFVFEPMMLGDVHYRDGGAVDRIGYEGWRTWRGDRPVVAHMVERSAGLETPLPDDVPTIRTPRSGARFWNLGDFDGQLEEARLLAHAVIDSL